MVMAVIIRYWDDRAFRCNGQMAELIALTIRRYDVDLIVTCFKWDYEIGPKWKLVVLCIQM